MQFKRATSLEAALEPGERILWQDRSSPARPRYQPVSWLRILSVEGKFFFLAIVLAVMAIAAALYIEGVWEKLVASAFAILMVAVTVFLARWIAFKLRTGEPIEVDFILTQHRLVSYQPRDKVYEEIALSRTVSMTKKLRALIILASDPDDEYHLIDLADVHSAEEAVSRALKAGSSR